MLPLPIRWRGLPGSCKVRGSLYFPGLNESCELTLTPRRLLLVEAVRILRQRRSKLYKSRLARSLFKLSLVLADLRNAEFAQHRDEAQELWKEVTGGGQPPEGEEGWDALLPYV